MEETTLPAEILQRVRQRLLREHPEMEGAEVQVTLRRPPGDQAAVAAKAGLPEAELPEETHYTVTMRKEVQAEDGVTFHLTVRVTVDARGQEIKRREIH